MTVDPKTAPLVVLESPFRGATPAEERRNVAYAKAAVMDCLSRGEAPIASHLLFAQPGILRDALPGERALGIAAGLAWALHAGKMVQYVDFGVSSGMQAARAFFTENAPGRPIEERRLPSFSYSEDIEP